MKDDIIAWFILWFFNMDDILKSIARNLANYLKVMLRAFIKEFFDFVVIVTFFVGVVLVINYFVNHLHMH